MADNTDKSVRETSRTLSLAKSKKSYEKKTKEKKAKEKKAKEKKAKKDTHLKNRNTHSILWQDAHFECSTLTVKENTLNGVPYSEKSSSERPEPEPVRHTYDEQQAHVDACLHQLCLVHSALAVAYSLKKNAFPKALAWIKLLNTLEANFGSMRLPCPSQCAYDMAENLQWQNIHTDHVTDSLPVKQFLASMAQSNQNKIVPTPFLDKAKTYFSKTHTISLPKTYGIDAREKRQRFMTHTVIGGTLRVVIPPESLLATLLKLRLVIRPYNDLYPSSNQVDTTKKTGHHHKYTFETNPHSLSQVIHQLNTDKDRLFPKVFYTSWTLPPLEPDV